MARTSYVFRRPILKTPNTSCVILSPLLLKGLGISFWLSADIHTDGAELLYSLWYRGWSNHHLGWWFCLLSLSVVIRCLATALVWQAQDHSDDEWPIITCNYQLLSPQYTDIIRDIILLLEEEEEICQMSVVSHRLICKIVRIFGPVHILQPRWNCVTWRPKRPAD